MGLREKVRSWTLGSSKRSAITCFFLLFFVAVVFGLLYKCVWDEEISYGDAFYFSFVTMTTLGYGDISPEGLVPRAFAIFQVMTGLVVIGSLVAFSVQDYVERQERKHLDSVRRDEESRRREKFDKYKPILMQYVDDYERSISSIACGKQSYGPTDLDVDFYRNGFRFSNLNMVFEPVLNLTDGMMVTRVENYFSRKSEFLEEIKYAFTNYEAVELEGLYDDFVNCFYYARKYDSSNMILQMVSEKKLGNDATLSTVFKSVVDKCDEAPDYVQGNVVNLAIDLYKDLLCQSEFVYKLRVALS